MAYVGERRLAPLVFSAARPPCLLGGTLTLIEDAPFTAFFLGGGRTGPSQHAINWVRSTAPLDTFASHTRGKGSGCLCLSAGQWGGGGRGSCTTP